MDNFVTDSVAPPPAVVASRQPYLIFLSGLSAGQLQRIAQPELTMGRAPEGDVVLDDVGISRRHAQVLWRDNQAFVRDLGSTNGTFLGETQLGQAEVELQPEDIVHLGSVVSFKFSLLDPLEDRLHQKLHHQATRDGLTGALNRREMTTRLEAEVSSARRYGTPLGLIMLDIDHFKQVNDVHGHAAGDAVLVEVTTTVLSLLRREDLLGRYGGEEFCLILRQTDPAGAHMLAERVRQAIADQQFTVPSPEGTKTLRVTVSLGVAQLVDSIYAGRLVECADKALYRAKSGGRNQVVRAD